MIVFIQVMKIYFPAELIHLFGTHQSAAEEYESAVAVDWYVPKTLRIMVKI